MARDDEQYRMLYANISNSKKLRVISGESRFKRDCHLVYTWLLAWADDDGRLRGRSGWVLENIFPYEGFTQNEIETILSTLHDINLIVWYEADDDRFIQIINPKHKSRKDRYKPSAYPVATSKKPSCQPSGCQSDNQSPKINKDTENKEEFIDNQPTTNGKPDSNPKSLSLSSSLSISAGEKPTDNQPPAVDNSPEEKSASLKEPDGETENYETTLRDLVNKIMVKYPNLAIVTFLQNYRRAHPKAKIHTLKSLLKHEVKVPEPAILMKYLEKTIEAENKNYNAADEDEKNKIFKADKNPLAALINNIGNAHSMPAG